MSPQKWDSQGSFKQSTVKFLIHDGTFVFVALGY